MIGRSLYDLFLSKSGVKSGGTMLSYSPPDMLWNDASSLTIPVGRYYQIGSRRKNQYDISEHKGDYWQINNPFTVTISGCVLDGCFVYNNWYSIFLTGEDSVQVLPFIRVYSVDYDVSYAGKTTFITGNQNVAFWDTQVEQTAYINSNDSWNGYRIRKWPNTISFVFVSPVMEIEDTINGASDQVIIDGDFVNTPLNPSWLILGAGNALQLLPPASTRHLYLGSIWVDGSGNMRQFIKKGWNYSWVARWSHDANKATSAANTFIGGIPPNASKVKTCHYVGEDDTNSSYGHYARIYTGDSSSSWDDNYPSGNNITQLVNYYNYNTTYKRSRQSLEIMLTNNQCIRNEFRRYSGSWQVPEFGYFDVYGWSE